MLLQLVVMLALAPAALADVSADHAAQSWIVTLLGWAEQHAGAALLLLAVADVLAVVLLLPAFLVAVGAGFLFGVVVGTLLMVVSTVCGAALAHALGARLLRARALRWLERHPRFARLCAALQDGGWRAIALLRLVPFLPFKTSNYLLGALRVPRAPFVLGTTLGILPMTVVTVSAGALADDLMSASTARPGGMANATLLLLAALAATLLAWHARRALRRAVPAERQGS
ncbi:MAG: TVP38/TMEM64 family protein [Gammaproteobacteria bacterium]